MKIFLATLAEQSESVLGTRPCEYVVAGLGSMALSQITPYSDLEFMILTENDDYKKNDDLKVREYFKNLAHLIHFRVINLGETVIPTSKYGIDLSHLTKVGVNFDLGGKTPLGRADKPYYELIKTVEGMLWYLRNEDNKVEHMDKNLPYILESCTYIYGKEELLISYKEATTYFLHQVNKDGVVNHKARAIKRLQEGVVERDYLGIGHNSHVKGDIEAHKPQLMGTDNEGKLFNVKQEIYRLPDRLLYGLAFYHGIQPLSVWDAVNKLKEDGIIGTEEGSIEAHKNLSYAATFAALLRLRTYLHNESQKESLSVFALLEEDEAKQMTEVFHLPEKELQDGGALFKYYYVALNLHKQLKKLCESAISKSQEIDLKAEKFFDESPVIKASIYARLLQYQAIVDNLRDSLTREDDIESLGILGKAYIYIDQYDKAVEVFNQANQLAHLNMGVENGDDNGVYDAHIHEVYQLQDIANSLQGLGVAYSYQREYNKALWYYKKALYIKEKIKESKETFSESISEEASVLYADIDYSIICTIFNIASIYTEKFMHHQALYYYKQIVMYTIKKDSTLFSSCLGNLAAIYTRLEKHDKALTLCARSLELEKHLYQNEPHPSLALLYNNMGGILLNSDQYDEGMGCLLKALEMRNTIFKGRPHVDIMQSLINIGGIHSQLEEYDKALIYYQQAEEVVKFIPHRCAQREDIDFLSNMAKAYAYQKQVNKAIEHCTRALSLAEEVYRKDQQDEMKYKVLKLKGGLCLFQGRQDEALLHYEEIIVLVKAIHKTEDHPDIADFLNNIAVIHMENGRYTGALNIFSRALAIREKLHDKINHPEIASLFNNIGTVHLRLEDHESALNCFERSLKMTEEIYTTNNHPSIAGTKMNIGNIYFKKGELVKAMGCFQDTLVLMKELYEENSPKVADVIANIGAVHKALGNLDEALGCYSQALAIRQDIWPEGHPDIAEYFVDLGDILLKKSQYHKALDNYEQAVRILLSIYGESDHPKVASHYNRIAAVHQQIGQYEEALSYYAKSSAMSERIYHDNPNSNIASIYNNVGNLLLTTGRYESALLHFQKALAIVQITDEKISVALSLQNIGLVHLKLGNSNEALVNIQQSLMLSREVYGEINHMSIATLLTNMGNIYIQNNELDEAERFYKQSLAMQQALCGNGEIRSEIALNLMNLGSIYINRGNYAEALDWSEKALYMKIALSGDQTVSVAESFSNVGLIHLRLNEYDKALVYFTKALGIYGSTNHPAIARTLNIIAVTYIERGDFIKGIIINFEALVVALKFGPHNDAELQRNVAVSAERFEERYHLELDIVSLMRVCVEQESDFRDYKLHKGGADICFETNEIRKAIELYKVSLLFMPDEEVADKISVYHNLGSACYVMSKNCVATPDEASKYYELARESFNTALKLSNDQNSGLHTEYANFLIGYQQYSEAFSHLIAAIEQVDQKVVGYGLAEMNVVAEALKEIIAQKSQGVIVSGAHYACYLLISNYPRFVEAELLVQQDIEVYVETFRQLINEHALPSSYLLLAKVYADLDKYDLVGWCLEQANLVEQLDNSLRALSTDVTVHRVKAIYDNALLNSPFGNQLLAHAYKIGGCNLYDLVLDLSFEPQAAEEMLTSTKEQGAEAVLYRLLGREAKKQLLTIKTGSGEIKSLVSYIDQGSGEILNSEISEDDKHVLRLDINQAIKQSFYNLASMLYGATMEQAENISQKAKELIQLVVDSVHPALQTDEEVGLLTFLYDLLGTLESGSSFSFPAPPGNDPNPDDYDEGNSGDSGDPFGQPGNGFGGLFGQTNSSISNQIGGSYEV